MVEFVCNNKSCEEYTNIVSPLNTELDLKDSYGNPIVKSLCPKCKKTAEIKTVGAPLQKNRDIRYFAGAKNGLKGSVY